MSTRTAGRARRNRMAGIRLCPPASTRASPPCFCNCENASSADWARTYSKAAGITANLLSRLRTRDGIPIICRLAWRTPRGSKSSMRRQSRAYDIRRISYNARMITGVVLAAGASTRIGRQKLLLQLGGETVIARTVRQISESGVDEVLVVVGFEHEKVATAVEGLGCRVAVNPDYATGMGSSFRTAIASM